MSEQMVVSKVEELMRSLDQVKRYKALARLMVDFLIIVLSSFVILFALELAVNFSHLTGVLQSYFGNLLTLTTTSLTSTTSTNLVAFIFPAAGVLFGITWVDYKLKRVKVETWRSTVNEGFAGALKLLQNIEWDVILRDIQDSKIIYALYCVVKVVGYWILATIILFIPYSIGLSLIHTSSNLYLLAFLSLIASLVLSRKDLQKKYQQITSLDALLWELRWFNSEFKTAEFQT